MRKLVGTSLSMGGNGQGGNGRSIGAMAKGKAKGKATACAGDRQKEKQGEGKLPRYIDSIDNLVKQMQDGTTKKLDPAAEEEMKKVMTKLAEDPQALKAAFSKLGRRMEPDALRRKPVAPEIIQRYATEKKDERKKFICLTEFIKDPSFGQMLIKEIHYKTVEDVSAKTMGMKTVGQVARHYNISHEKALKIVEGKESEVNPDAPDDPEMRLYKVFLGEVDTNTESKGHKTELTVEAQVAPENASMAQGLVDEMTRGASSNSLKGLLNAGILPDDDQTKPGKRPRGRGRDKTPGRTSGGPKKNKKMKEDSEGKSLKWLVPVGDGEDNNAGTVKAADPEKAKEEKDAANVESCKSWAQNLGAEALMCSEVASSIRALKKTQYDGMVVVLTGHAEQLRTWRSEIETYWANKDWVGVKDHMHSIQHTVEDWAYSI